MPTYFVLVSLAGFEPLRREIGYSRALREIDGLRDRLAVCLPEAAPRANRATVEFLLDEPSAEAMTNRLTALIGEVGGGIRLRGRTAERHLVAVAVRCPAAGQVSCGVIARAEEGLAAVHGPSVQVVELDQEQHAEHLLMGDLRKALRADDLRLVYQPKLNARGGGVVGAEALLRWDHPVHGPISPALFIPAAERNGEIRGITDWVLSRALADAKTVCAADLTCPIHVNISAPLIGDSAFVEQALAILGADTGLIGFEITETSMMSDPEGTLVNLHRLAAAGVALSIDDYGAAFSSLTYLQRLPVGEIKIDQSFIARLTSGSRDPLLVRSTIDLAHALEMKVTAEGVESAAALALLQVMQCDMVQGFLLSRPVPLDELIAFAKGERGAAPVASNIAQGRWAKLARSARS
jgi:EAL domain-containing protein (putative c-di-GMP-specific phosphodiesterase class I)